MHSYAQLPEHILPPDSGLSSKMLGRPLWRNR